MRWIAGMLVMGMAVMSAVGQAPAEQKPAFEVASVKRATDGPGYYGVNFFSARVTAHGSVNMLIADAYGVPLRQVEGESPILKQQNFDIDARPPANFVPSNAPAQERKARLRLMMQTLLKERFRLAVHKEIRDLPVYLLVVAKNGPKLKPAPSNTDCPMDLPCSRRSAGPATGLLLPETDISSLTTLLTFFVGRTVVDRTGIQGHFEINLPPWTPTNLLGTQPIVDDREPAPDPNGDSLFNIIQEHLGLRLESSRAPLDIYVVDHLEQPSAN